MMNSHVERVLGRLGARELTSQEIEKVSGGDFPMFHTNVCTFAGSTGPGDGDGGAGCGDQ